MISYSESYFCVYFVQRNQEDPEHEGGEEEVETPLPNLPELMYYFEQCGVSTINSVTFSADDGVSTRLLTQIYNKISRFVQILPRFHVSSLRMRCVNPNTLAGVPY